MTSDLDDEIPILSHPTDFVGNATMTAIWHLTTSKHIYYIISDKATNVSVNVANNM